MKMLFEQNINPAAVFYNTANGVPIQIPVKK